MHRVLFSSLLVQPENAETDLIEFFLEWSKTHVNLLKSAIILTLVIDIALILIVIVRKNQILKQIEEHNRIEKWFILSFFSAAIFGASLFVMAFGFFGLYSAGVYFVPVLLATPVLLVVVCLSLVVCFTTFALLFAQLFMKMQPVQPVISGAVNWGGTPVLVVVVAFFVVSVPLAFISGTGSSVAGYGVLIVFPLFLVLKTYRGHLDALGFKKPVVKILLISLPLVPVLILGNNIIYEITERIIGQFPLDEFTAGMISENPVVMVILMGGLGPVGEEIFFRGFAYGALKRKYGVRNGILLSSLFFGAFHMIPWQIPYAFMAGCILSYVYEKTGSIYSPILFHILNNVMAVIEVWM